MKTINFLKILPVMALPLLFSGCISPDESESRGVKLSQAMQSSAKDDHQDLGGGGSHDTSPNVSVNVIGDTADSLGFGEVSYDKSEYVLQVPVDVSYSVPFNGDIHGDHPFHR